MSDDNNNRGSGNPLGKNVDYETNYQPSLLFPIARQDKRNELGFSTDLSESLPFDGADIWNAYELSWLNSKGLPQVAIAEFIVPANSPNIIESKSFKLYLNSLNQSQFESQQALQETMQNDLSQVVGENVSVTVTALDSNIANNIGSFEADCIDHQEISIKQYDYDPSLLKLDKNESISSQTISESLCSHLLKSNCLITNQPDWASVLIQYKGAKICHASLLQYLVSFRTHNEFHEQCVERIFCDILNYCQPHKLTVYARYTRRGGLDINPWRSNCVASMDNIRLVRQ